MNVWLTEITDDMGDFVISDESDAPSKSKKRKRPAAKSAPAPRKRYASSPTPAQGVDVDEDESLPDVPSTSTAQQWLYDPNNVTPQKDYKVAATPTPRTSTFKIKERACDKEPDERHRWLAEPRDADRNPPGHPDFDPSTLYVPPQKFSAFEQQYWDIKKKLWDTIVFFKKGKFYELYENDATLGHQLFDLKMTDRVNMRMVGVPEGSLDMWVNQFIAKGYKVARVDQMESALGSTLR